MNEHKAAERIIKGQRDENARLRRANAKLLEALEGLFPMLDAKQRYDRSLTDVGHAVINQARAAIAAARG